MIEEFISKLQGTYNNWKQAASSPRDHSYVHVVWENLGNNKMSICQWYDHEGQNSPYRFRYHKIVEKDDIIIVENWGDDWNRSPAFDMGFAPIDGFYKGGLMYADPMIRGTSLKSFVEFNGQIYKSMDQGWKDGNLEWGSLTMYEFEKE